MAGKVKVKVTLEGSKELLDALKKVVKDVNTELKTAALNGAEVIHDAAEALAPGPYLVVDVDEKPGRVTTEIKADRDHWHYRFFELGADTHEITAKKGVRLSFVRGGQSVVVSGVQHPGMAAKPFLRPAFDANQDRAEQAVADYLKKVIEP